ncbi:MAG: ion transporter [Gemmatimonadetes bacterium]|nr:ion transporter [Gemmatimonadota bacterium]
MIPAPERRRFANTPDRLRPAASETNRRRVYDIIFGHETAIGRRFDVVLILAILASVAAVMLESVTPVREAYGPILRAAEWVFTIVFTIEYVVRLWCVARPALYARSALGIIDLLAILPTYISVLLPGGQVLAVVRILRVLRVFRILKLAHYTGEAGILLEALRASRYKITVFVFAVMTIVVIVGSLMFLVEGEGSGFTSIPRGVYWAIVTLTTVGYGDIAPQTPLGQAMAAVVMIMGYGIIAVPTGIVTAEIAYATRRGVRPLQCLDCLRLGHDDDAAHCKWCGGRLTRTARDPETGAWVPRPDLDDRVPAGVRPPSSPETSESP